MNETPRGFFRRRPGNPVECAQFFSHRARELCGIAQFDQSAGVFFVTGRAGPLVLSDGDWIVAELDGTLTTMSDDTFLKAYEKVHADGQDG
jgi:hypothetical protein